ncbi:MAG: serine protease, partial [Flavobacteriales bacterium]
MKKVTLITSFLFFLFSVKGQLSQGGEPYSIKKGLSLKNVPINKMPTKDLSNVLQKKNNDKKKTEQENIKVYDFAYNIDVSIGFDDGKWQKLKNGDRIWRTQIHSKDALNLNFGFSLYDLPKGAELFIYTPDHKHILGAFTHKNNKNSGRLATTVIRGERAIVELYEPASVKGETAIKIGRVSHGYKEFYNFRNKRGFGDAGSCNMNVNCPDGQPWQDQKRSQAMSISGGTRRCSGAILNNTAEDGTPYYLTANHCLNSSVSSWVFMFNYESPNCSDIDGPTDFTVSGATLRANNSDSDFGLLELSKVPPDSFDVYYAGWDHTGRIPDSTTCIHHPSNDIMKISFDLDSPEIDQGLANIDSAEWHIKEWDRNTTTEGGSSGAPLFDDQKRIIGQL